MNTLTEAERDEIGNFAHRAQLFTQSLEEGNYSAALELAREYDLTDQRVLAALNGMTGTNPGESLSDYAYSSVQNMRNALRAAHEVGR